MATAYGRTVYNHPAYKAAVKRVKAERPHCAYCLDEGIRVWGDHTDHIVALEDGGAPFDVSNLQRLCSVPCHSKKTAAERRRRRAKAVRLTDDFGRPLNPS